MRDDVSQRLFFWYQKICPTFITCCEQNKPEFCIQFRLENPAVILMDGGPDISKCNA